MNGLVKMYCYKMFRQKSLYIIWVLLVGFAFLSLPMAEEMTFSGLLCETGAFYVLFVSIFSAVFFSADISSGFIKNYAGSVSDRSVIITARSLLVLIQNVLTMLVLVIADFCITRNIGDAKFGILFGICTFLAGMGCSFLALLVTELTRKTVPAIILTITIGSGIMCNLLGTISVLLTNGHFVASNFLVTGVLEVLSGTHSQTDAVIVILMSCVYILISFIVGIISIKKRDVV